MKRNNEFNKYKIMNISTNKTVLNVYMDSFEIEKVRFNNANYETKEQINCYLDFPLLARLNSDVNNGRLFKQIQEQSNHQLTISMGGSASSKDYNGEPESRILSIGMLNNNIFVNMSKGKGKLNKTGLIMPDGSPTIKISVSMTIDDFRSLIIYTHDCVNAFLVKHINQLYSELKKDKF